MEIRIFLEKMLQMKASDLFITVDRPICVKVNTNIINLTEEKLTPEQTKNFAFSLMTAQQQADFLTKKEFNFALQEAGLGRFRINVFVQRSFIGMVLRRIETRIPSLEELNLDTRLAHFVMQKRGLIIVVGAAGMGKSSTLAALIGYRNYNSTGHIISVEDPIEFVHEHQGCIITQREVGVDTESFIDGLKNMLRQTPDVVYLGEVRAEDTMNYALNFAETGHLCLTTLHANNANQALDRIINFFPIEKHAQVWTDLSLNLQAIIAQQLLPTKDGTGLVPVTEVLVNTPAVADNIKKGEISLLKEFMAKGAEQGMQTFDQSLFQLYKADKITYDNALFYADSYNELRLMIKLAEGAKPNSSLDGVNLQDR
jgi:twitching motility protein PilU